MGSRLYQVCFCGHLDDDHQTLLPEHTVLIDGQKHCYLCECEGWSAAVETRRSVNFRAKKRPLLKTLELMRERGWDYKWIS